MKGRAIAESCWGLIALAVSILWGLCAGIALIFVAQLHIDFSWYLGLTATIPVLEIWPLIFVLRRLSVGRIAGVAEVFLAHLMYVVPFYALTTNCTELYDLKPLATYYPILSAVILAAAWLALPRSRAGAVRATSTGLVLAATFFALPIVVISGLYSYDLITFKRHMIGLQNDVRKFALERLHVGMSRSELYALEDESERTKGFTFSIVGAQNPHNGADQISTQPMPTRSHPHPVVQLLISGDLCLPNVQVYFDKEDRVERWDQIPTTNQRCVSLAAMELRSLTITNTRMV
jgi:hypothetical protein